MTKTTRNGAATEPNALPSLHAASLTDAHASDAVRMDALLDAFEEFFLEGAKSEATKVGIELEHFLLRNDGSAAPYREEVSRDGRLRQGYVEAEKTNESDVARGDETLNRADVASRNEDSNRAEVASLLELFAEDYDERLVADDGELIGLARLGETITLEPAAQFELSAGPFERLAEGKACLEDFERHLDEKASRLGMKSALVGYHPSSRAEELSIIPKTRYEFMDRHFRSIGPWGVRMMRASASTQVSIDYTSEADAMRKFRLAVFCAPLLALITDNSPFFEGAPSPHQLIRTAIWQGCDPARCGTPPGSGEEGYRWRDYARWVLNVPAILVPYKSDTSEEDWCYTEQSFAEIYAGIGSGVAFESNSNVGADSGLGALSGAPLKADPDVRPFGRRELEHALSMVFPDVRLKHFLELRPADALPVPYAIAYAALVKGLFLGSGGLARMENLFDGLHEGDIDDAKNSLMRNGYDGVVYGRAAGELAEALADAALAGLDESERALATPLVNLIAQRTTLAQLSLENR